MSDVTVKTNIDEFQKVLNRYLGSTSRKLPEALNQKMFYIARGASRETPKANKAEFEKELGVTGYKVMVGKRGKPLMRHKKIRWQKVYSNGLSLAALIVNARRGRSGGKGLYGAEMKAAIKKLIGKRSAAVGTEKAGWWKAIRAFGAAVKESSFREVNVYRLKGNPSIKIAKPGWSPSAQIGYAVNAFDTHHNNSIDPRVVAATSKAFSDEMRSMESHMRKKLQEVKP